MFFFFKFHVVKNLKTKQNFCQICVFFIEGAMCLSLIVVTVMPVIAGRAHNPFLSFSLLLATMMLLYRLWTATFSDAQITAFHLLVNAVNIFKYFKQVSGANFTFSLIENRMQILFVFHLSPSHQ